MLFRKQRICRGDRFQVCQVAQQRLAMKAKRISTGYFDSPIEMTDVHLFVKQLVTANIIGGWVHIFSTLVT